MVIKASYACKLFNYGYSFLQHDEGDDDYGNHDINNGYHFLNDFFFSRETEGDRV